MSKKKKGKRYNKNKKKQNSANNKNVEKINKEKIDKILNTEVITEEKNEEQENIEGIEAENVSELLKNVENSKENDSNEQSDEDNENSEQTNEIPDEKEALNETIKNERNKKKEKNLKKKKNKKSAKENEESNVKEEQKDKEKEETKTKENKNDKKDNEKRKKIIKKIVIAIAIIVLICVGVLAYLIFTPKFKDIQIELGTKEVKIEEFLTLKIFRNGAEFVTDLSTIDFTQVGEYEIVLKYKNKEETVKLKIADTTPPEVTVQNITKYIDYQINPEDFIVEKKDQSEITVELIDAPQIAEFGNYNITIKIKDIHGNETIKTCILTITWIKPEIYVELGTEITLADLVFDIDEYGENVSQEDFANVNTSAIGEYIVNAEREGAQYQTKVIVQDTTPPTLELKDLSIYDDEKVSDYTDFIKTVSDASGEPTTALKTEINYKILGTQNIVIEAVDINGNRVEQTAVLTIKKDDEGPVISGVKDISIEKYGSIDYYKGVSANDKKDGKCEVTVDSSNVNINVAGTYYATYTSKDKKGNTTTVKRKITVQHNQEDTTAKFNEFYNNYCAGKDPVGIASAVREHVKYNSNWGGDDPVWYGLTEGRGNCYVHARILQRALQQAGYQNRIIYLTDESHYWNLVYVNGVWRHLDGTPSANHTLGLLTDEQKLADPGVHQKTWDREAWPAAE